MGVPEETALQWARIEAQLRGVLAVAPVSESEGETVEQHLDLGEPGRAFQTLAGALAAEAIAVPREARQTLRTLAAELGMQDDPDWRAFTSGVWDALSGSELVVAITYLTLRGELAGRLQFHGRVERAGRDLVEVRRDDLGELFALPPALEAYEPAAPGEHRLAETGEVVLDPDFICTLTVHLAS